MISIHRDGQILGPYSTAQVRGMSKLYRLQPQDLFAWPGAKDWISLQDFKSFLRLMEDDETVQYGDRDIVVTERRVLSKGRAFPRGEITALELLILDPKATARRNRPAGHLFFWALAVILCWTLVVPVVVWFITKKDISDEGLGAIHGIRLQGAFGTAMVKDGIGMLEAQDVRRSELEEVYRLLRAWKAREGQFAPALELPVESGVPATAKQESSSLVVDPVKIVKISQV